MKLDALRGFDIVDTVVRLCAMNLLLHVSGRQEKSPNRPYRPTTRCAPIPATATTS